VALFWVAWVAGCHATNIESPDEVRLAHVLWQAQVNALGPPALDDQSVYFSTRDHSLAAVNRATGDVRWIAYSGVSGNPPARDTPVRAADVVVFGDEYLFGLELANGTRRWVFGKSGGQEPRAGIYPFGTDGTRVYAGSVVGAVFAVDAATGQQVWRTDLLPGTDHQVRVFGVRDGRVYLTVRYDGPFYVAKAYALDAAKGTVVWSYDLGRSSISLDALISPPVVGGTGSLFLIELDDGHLVALNGASGAQIWTIDRVVTGTTGDGRQLTVSGNVLVATSTGGMGNPMILGYDLATGAERWRVPSDQGASSLNLGALSSDSTLAYVAFSNGVIGAYELATGNRRWLRRAPVGFFVNAPRISRDTLFLGGYEAAYAIAR
jgi:outer membrane protein assembly factor BamB